VNIFKGRKIVIATAHNKEEVIAPLLEEALDVAVIIPQNFNSDTFGTFTREIKRAGDQLEAARAKVYAAMEQEGVDLGVSSEGSFGSDPSTPFIQSNFELVLLIDKKHNYEIKGHYKTSKTNISGEYVSSIEEALEFAQKIGFPKHGIIVRKSDKNHNKITKDIHTEADLKEKVTKLLSSPFTKKVFLETDMRAHKNPTRMQAIELATKDLIKNIKSLCPDCSAPGFTIIDYEKGLRCSHCKFSTDTPLYDIYQCNTCGYKEKKLVTKYGDFANPQYCENCNP
jgi:hypothetical protein